MITLVGLGPGDSSTLSIGAKLALEEASNLHKIGSGYLLLRTGMHPIVEELQQWGVVFDTFDSLYETLPNFQELYSTIASKVIALAQVTFPDGELTPVFYAVPGHPLFAEETVRQIRELAAAIHIPVRIISSISFVDAVLTAVECDLADGCDIRDALALPIEESISLDGYRLPGRPDPACNLLLYQVYDTQSASHAKLALMHDYPDDWLIQIVRWAGIPGREEVQSVPLYMLDRVQVDYLTSVFVSALPPELRKSRLPELVGLMAKLRAPDGCPWDREQTPQTLRRFLIEETYEAIEAIDNDDPELLCEELGDVLLQIVFHAQLASEVGDFTIDDVTETVIRKMVRRHPHVFGTQVVKDSDEVLRNWEQIKKLEKQNVPERRRDSVLDGVPKGLPALMQAMEVSKRAVKVGFEWGSIEEVFEKLDEEIGELKAELFSQTVDPERTLSEIGDLLFTVVQIARWSKLDGEEALRSMVARFERRFRHMEKSAEVRGSSLSELTMSQLDTLWLDAKRNT